LESRLGLKPYTKEFRIYVKLSGWLLKYIDNINDMNGDQPLTTTLNRMHLKIEKTEREEICLQLSRLKIRVCI
jgi:hypothetical protein